MFKAPGIHSLCQFLAVHCPMDHRLWSSIGPVVVKVVSVWLVTFDCQNSALFIFVKVARMMISHNNSFHSSGTDDSHGLDSFSSTSFSESIIFLSFPIKSTNKWTLKDFFHSQGQNIVHAILNIDTLVCLKSGLLKSGISGNFAIFLNMRFPKNQEFWGI